MTLTTSLIASYGQEKRPFHFGHILIRPVLVAIGMIGIWWLINNTTGIFSFRN